MDFREVKFWLDKKLTFELLKSKIKEFKNFNERIVFCGKAIKKLLEIKKSNLARKLI